MAESVVKLKLESGEYDSKIKRAAQNILSFGENCQKAGQSVAKADKDTLEYVQSIGKMETVAKNTKGKINELTTAFTDLSVQYKNLTDEEKNSPFGQALSQSLDQLKTRINESKAQLSEVNQSLQGTSNQSEQTGGVMQQLANKFTLNVDVMKVFNIGMKAVGVALDVAKDAFFASEATVDAWGRTIEAGKSVYEGFLFALNTGDFSGFINNINSIISAAQKAYDALDRLGTMQRILAPSMSEQSAETQRLRQMLQTGTYIAPEDGRTPTPGMKNGQRLTPDQMKRVEQQLSGSIQKEVGYQREIIGQTNASIDAVYEQFASQMGITVQEFRKGTSSMKEFERRVNGGRNYTRWNLANSPANSYYVSGASGEASGNKRGKNPFSEFKGWDVFRVDGEPYGKLVDLIKQRNQQINSIYALETQGQRVINRVEGVTPRGIMGGGVGGGRSGGSGGGRGGGGANTLPPEGSIAAQEAKVQALTKAWREATDEVGRAGYAGMLEEAKQVLDQMQGKTADIIPEGSFKDLKNQLGELQKQRELLADPVDIAIIDQDIERIKEKIDTLNGVMKQGSTTMSLEEKIRTNLADSITAVDENTLTNLLEFKIKNGLDGLDIPADYLQEAIFRNRMNIPDEYWQNLQDQINEQIKNTDIDPIVINVETGEITQVAKKAKDGWQDAAQAVQAVGGALQQLEDPSAKIMGIIGEAIANIALGFAQATAKTGAAGGIFGWIAAIAGGIGTMTSTIAAIKAATAGSYAEGGIIPGNNFNDGLIANVSSGELILNRAQQNSIAGQLTATQGGGEMQPYLDVETIWLGLGHLLKRRGMGEILTSKSSRS